MSGYAEHEERVRLRELQRAAREAGHRCAAAERVRESEERTGLASTATAVRAKAPAGHRCQRKGLGRGGRCPTMAAPAQAEDPEGRQRVAEAQRRRWAARFARWSVTPL